MSTNRSFWKVWLRPYLLTQEVENDYTAEVSTVGVTLRNEDIAALIIAEGSEIKYDTILSIMNQVDRIKCDKLIEGCSVHDGICLISPRIRGIWTGASAKYDPSIHTLTFDMKPSTDLRKRLLNVVVQILGVKDSGAFIGLVTDLSTGLKDDAIVPDEDIAIEGAKLRVGPDEDAEMGVFFIPSEGGAPVKASKRLAQNDPKKIILRVPAGLPDGKYRLQIVTKFANQNTNLKEARHIEYERLLVIRGGAYDKGNNPGGGNEPGGGGSGGNGGGGIEERKSDDTQS